MGMVIIPMSIMHISIPKRIAIMSVRLLPVPGVPVRFVVHRVALKTYHVNRLIYFWKMHRNFARQQMFILSKWSGKTEKCPERSAFRGGDNAIRNGKPMLNDVVQTVGKQPYLRKRAHEIPDTAAEKAVFGNKAELGGKAAG